MVRAGLTHLRTVPARWCVTRGNTGVGKLARFGIAGGERVSVRTLGCLPVPIPTDDFAERAIRELGFDPIRDRVIARESLGSSEIGELIVRAPLSVLMKLVEFGSKATARVEPTPIVVVSLFRHEQVSPIEYLVQIEHPTIEVLLDRVDLDDLGDGLEERIAAIAGARAGLTLVGPAAEDILLWLQAKGRSSRVLRNLSLSDVVRRLRAAGVTRLRACRDLAALSEVNSVGIGQSFCTTLDSFVEPRRLAEHLASIDALSRRAGLVSVWFPGLSRACKDYPLAGAALDLMMLRMLAIGTLALPAIDRRRASSRYMSIEAFTVAHLCGANDFGLGAVDGATEQTLQLKQFGALQKALPADGETPVPPRSGPRSKG